MLKTKELKAEGTKDLDEMVVRLIKWYSGDDEMRFFYSTFLESLWTRGQLAFGSISRQSRTSLLRSIGVSKFKASPTRQLLEE